MHPSFARLTQLQITRPLLMGILNVTPDSFADGGQHSQRDAAIAHAQRMVAEGADIIDIGGESTRPGAAPVSLDQELERVLPVARALGQALPGVAWSIDTQKAEVARQALALGACLVNDVSALSDPAMGATVAASGAGVVLMHRLEAPGQARWSAQETSRYTDKGVVAEVSAALRTRMQTAFQAGIRPERVWLDPGFGFGKSIQDNQILLARLAELTTLGHVLLVGLSRKSFLGAERRAQDRLDASLAAAVSAVKQGARVLRVHDVAATATALGL